MLAGRAFLWCFFSLMDVAAVPALPFHNLVLAEDFVIFDVLKKLPVSLFMMLFNFPDFLE